MRRSSLVAAAAVLALAAGCGGSVGDSNPDGSDDALVVIGDFGVGGETQQRLGDAVQRYVRTRGAGLLLTAGDNDYSEGSDFSRDWSSSFGWTRGAGVSIAGTLGNHDVIEDGGRYQFDELQMPGAYYRRSFGSVDIFALDSNRPRDEQQRAWLAQALSESSARWKIGVFHHVAYSCGEYADETEIRALVDLMRQNGVRLVLTGHDHNYQRFDLEGMTVVVAGWGGRDLYDVDRCPEDTPAPAAARDDVYGFVAVRVGSQRLEGEAITLDGEVVDSFQVER